MNKNYFLPAALFFLVFLVRISLAQNTNSCVVTNAGFESGNTSGWICKSGYYGTGPCPTGTCPRFNNVYTGSAALNPGGINAALNSAGDRHVITTGAGMDANSNNTVPVVAPGGGTYSFRLGNSVAGGVNVGGVNYAQAEAVRLDLAVTSQNAAFTYRYAYFVQDPSHQFNAQPTFEVVVLDQNGNQIPCGHYFVVAGNFPSCVTAAGFQTGTGLWVYKNWTDVGLDLSGYIGTTVSVEFRTFDCFPGGGGGSSTSCVNNSCTYCTNGNCCTYTSPGSCTPPTSGNTCSGNSAGSHSAYAYIDAYCSPLAITAPVFCVGTSSISICAPTGYSSYSWPAGQPGLSGTPNTQCVTINNPVAGTTYTVNMTSATGCPVNTTVTLQSTVAQASAASTICKGSSATLTATGGGTYSWNTGATGSSITVNPTSSANYSVLVTNGSCTATATSSVTVNSVTSTANSTQAGCSVANGTATANPAGGTPNYTYLWSPGNQATQTATGLAIGNYTVLVTDSQGCTSTSTVSITATSPPNVTATSTQAGCSVANGTATANPTVGTPNYTYLWSPGNQVTQTATGLAIGNYTVLITDANGCTATTTVNITATSSPSVTATSTQAGCSVANGTATANPTAGTPNYTYLWSPGNQVTQTATALAGGNYTVLITDANGCTATTTVSVTATSQPSVTATSTLAGCSVANGTATANPTGGTPGYTFLWSPGNQTSQTATALAGGTYTVLVTDNNGCTQTTTVNIGSTTAPTATASSTQSTCAVANGTGTVIPAGGTPAYTYNWSGGQTTPTATGFSPGNYTVVVTDANGCTTSASVTITAANGPTVTLATPTHVFCNGGTNGSVSASVSGGTPGFTYAWSNGQSGPSATGLASGTYTLVVTDANNCSFTTITSITEPAALALGVSSSMVSCNGGNNGSATGTPSGGTPGYTYFWSNGQTNPTATGLGAGTYTLTVTDSLGCTTTSTVSVSEPPMLTSVASSTVSVSCNGGNNGSATVFTGGGTPAYTYLWSTSPPQTGPTATGLTAGSYTVTVTDNKGCTQTSTVSIAQPAVLTSAVSSSVSVSCNGGNNGSATVTAGGGTPGYTYLWSTSPVQTSTTATGLGAGNYTVTVTDNKGCTKISTVTITQPTALINTVASSVNPGCNGGNNGSATAAPSGGTPNYTYAWSTTPAQNTATATGLGAGTYTVTVTDSRGCTKTASVTITQPPVLTFSLSGSDSICIGENSTLVATVAGGTPAYTYVWTPGPQSGPSVVVSPATSTSYSVTVTDSKGCTSLVQTFNVAILPSPTAYFDTASHGTYSVLYNFTDLSSGGITWLWNFGDGSTSTLQHPVHTFPGAGTYTVIQTTYNQYGCPDTFTVVLRIEEGIIIPNVFTPNGDGPNDVWYIPNSGMKEFHVEIFDRWGLKVWETTADEIRWDGRSLSGYPLTDGTYFYTLRAILKSGAEGKDYSTTGYVTLLTRKK